MRHNVKGRKLKRTSSHKKALMRTLVTQLLEYKRIHTTEAKAKELRPYAEKIITKARIAYQREQQGLLADGQTYDVHTRRLLGRDIRKKEVIESLFDEIIPEIGDRPGGYTRIVKTGIRRGDSGRSALIELVDYNTEIVAATNKKAKRKSTPKKVEPVVKDKEETTVVDEVIDSAEEVAEDTIAPVAETTSDVVEEVTEKVEEVAESVAETTEEVVDKATETVEEVVEKAEEVVEDVKETVSDDNAEKSDDEVKSEKDSDETTDEDKKKENE